MKKLLIFLIFTLGIGVIVFFVFQKKQNSKIDKVVKEISSLKKVKCSVKTILFTKNKAAENHFTNLKDVVFYRKNIIITKGGIIKGDFVNKYYNASEFKEVTAGGNSIAIGYRDGFLLLTDKYINHFVFNEEVKKCVFASNRLFCIKNNVIITKDKNDFIEYYKSKEKITDLAVFHDKIYILTSKKLIIKDEYSKNELDVLNANKLLVLDSEVFLLSDREIFKVKDSLLKSFKKFSSINNLILKDGKIYFISISGVVYNSELKKVYSLDSLINGVSYIYDDIYILTPKGIFIWKNDIDKFNLKILESGIVENYITGIKKYNDNLLISYFNSGIDILNKNMVIKDFIKGLNGINDILFKNDILYVATTNGLHLYDNNKITKSYGKKDGILGRSISKIEWYKNSIFIGSEGGVSQKKENLFYSINGMHGLVNNRVNCLKKVNNYLFVGTLGGISILDGLKVIKTLSNKAFKSRWITGIEFIKDTVYIGTYGGGVYKYSLSGNVAQKEIVPIIKEKKRIFINLNTLFNYKNKYLLAGTLKNGIFIYNIEKKEYFFLKDLPSLNITAINVVDGKLFIGSDFGFWDLNIKNVME